jgi:putative membrane protein
MAGRFVTAGPFRLCLISADTGAGDWNDTSEDVAGAGPMMWDWGMALGGWLWMLGGLILVIGIVVLVVAAIVGFGGFADRRSEGATRPDPIDILRERFARGEITEDEFEQAKRALGYH